MLKEITHTINARNMLVANDGVVVALSGGADSVALLAVLTELRARRTADGVPAFSLYAAHINHNLREEAARDEHFVRELCEKMRVPLRVYGVDVRGFSFREKIGTEEAARILRYRALYDALADFNAQKIATGHNADDNAETVLMNLCRGAGLRGLTGIPPVNGNIIRPLLETTRADILAYLTEKNLSYITDATNASSEFTRNRVRHHIMPALQEHVNSAAVMNIARAAEFLRADKEFLEACALERFAQIARWGADFVELDIPALLQLSDALKSRVVREAIAQARGRKDTDSVSPASAGTLAADCFSRHIAAVLDIASGASGREVHLPDITVRREFNVLRFFTACPRGTKYVTLPHDATSCSSVPAIRTRRAGDRIILPAPGGGTYTKKLKDYFIEKKIPRHMRDNIRLMAVGNRIIKIIDMDGGLSMHQNESVEVLISAEDISIRLQSLAEEIKRDYGDRPLILMCALTGGVIFLADLSRRLGDNATIDFVRASSYGDGTATSGTVTLDCHPKLDIVDKEVLLVEDIIDSGRTLAYLKTYLRERGAKDMRVCALLDKPSRREVDVMPDYLGFSIPDEFVVGYGLDYAQRYRNLPYVGVLKFS